MWYRVYSIQHMVCGIYSFKYMVYTYYIYIYIRGSGPKPLPNPLLELRPMLRFQPLCPEVVLRHLVLGHIEGRDTKLVDARCCSGMFLICSLFLIADYCSLPNLPQPAQCCRSRGRASLGQNSGQPRGVLRALPWYLKGASEV